MEAPIIEPDKEYDNKEYTIKSNKNNSFNIKITNYSSFLEINAFLKEDCTKKEFTKKFYLEELTKNKYLSLCDNINEIYKQIIFSINKNSLSVIEENKQIKINIPVDHIIIKEIILTIPEKIKKDSEKIDDIINEIKFIKESLRDKIVKLENENISFKSEINNLNKKIVNLEKENKDLKDRVEKLELLNIEKKEKSESLNESSIIINQNEKQNILIKWIKEKTNKEIKKFNLIYKMSVNGTDSDNFHNLCDYKGPNLTLIETTKGKKFGGFTPLSWVKEKSFKDPSNQTFIFSLDRKEKYDIIKDKINENVINGSEGPYFGCEDIHLYKNMRNGITYANKYCYFIENKNFLLTGGKNEEEKFEIKELEIFQVLFN